MLINNQDIYINIEEELDYYNFDKARIRGKELICCSPFRNESSPSFSINLETGLWIDFGADSNHNHKGNLITLLAHLSERDYSEVAAELLDKYGTPVKHYDGLDLELSLMLPEILNNKYSPKVVTSVSPYLCRRGIKEIVQEQFQISEENGVVNLVWHDKNGSIINVKHRMINAKTFYYDKGGQPVKNHLYGLFMCRRIKADTIFICESEIDALTLWGYGVAAVATGGSSLSQAQKKLLLDSGATKIVIATDNDSVGHRFREFLKEEFLGLVKVFDINFPVNRKDINELSHSELENVIKTMKECGL